MRIKAVAFDVDGVLTEAKSIWKFIHSKVGTLDEAEKNTKLYYSKKISYLEWAKLDASLWKGLSYKEFLSIIDKVRFKRYARELSLYLKSKNIKLFAVSAGLSLLTNKVIKELNFDFAVSNEIVFKNGIATGDVKVNVAITNKGEVLRRICKNFGIPLTQTISVGNDEVDISMFKETGLSIALNPEDLKVAKSATLSIYGDLDRLLTLFKFFIDY